MKIWCNTPAEAAASIRAAHLEGGYFSITSPSGHRSVWLAESGPGRKTAFLVQRAGLSNAQLKSYDLEEDVIWENAERPGLTFPRRIRFAYDYKLTYEARQALGLD